MQARVGVFLEKILIRLLFDKCQAQEMNQEEQYGLLS